MREGCCRRVGNCANIKIWADPWVPNLPKKSPERRINILTELTMTKDLIIHDEHRWDIDKLKHLSTQFQVKKIIEIHLPTNDNNPRNKLLWTPHPTGEYSAKSYQNTLTDRQPTSSPASEFQRKRLWKVRNIAPKVQFFIGGSSRMGLQ
ncbi:uncharacterized protein LOC113338017 [Papaver somniferum]|uniref:uncharacterized protein LOC113338017 n=1 Tax=Papaver somniferum TaxID=3469 RepID=UPI000E704D84|nr:uncharacterized protein LOC113338017 [Papaver somniferum]